jgi:2-polyprenyl-3-methyl-5-hydroxy-6-metoxy-1,4-benzoquinol methylase
MRSSDFHPQRSHDGDSPRWREFSRDPNAPEVLAARKDALTKARGACVDDRAAHLCNLARGKRVLDIGIVEHFFDTSASEQWLHGKLCRVAKQCVGIDILAEELLKLRQRGYDVRNVDLTLNKLDEKFDVIVMGEIIEHVDKPGALLANAAAMLEADGCVVVTTPNPWYVNVIIKNLLRGASFSDSADHVGWYDASTLFEIGQRNGLELQRYTGVRAASARTILGRLVFQMAPLLIAIGINQFLFAKTIIYEFRLRNV